MIEIDADSLLHACNANAPERDRARARLEGIFSSGSSTGLSLVSVLSFIRISTDPQLDVRFPLLSGS